YKFYFTDIGLRNARLNFRQIEENHLMENIIFNELIARNYLVDVGVVEINELNKTNTYSKKTIWNWFCCKYGKQKNLYSILLFNVYKWKNYSGN
ncbi:hypothetical protein PUW90_02615, partial [Metamycoplasma hyosynoviae]|nr:hypothetical protein [Metamycoplasma hyosynoviae]